MSKKKRRKTVKKAASKAPPAEMGEATPTKPKSAAVGALPLTGVLKGLSAGKAFSAVSRLLQEGKGPKGSKPSAGGTAGGAASQAPRRRSGLK